MSDPQRPIGKTPPRAEPLQPDKPGAGDELVRGEERARPDDAARQRAEQESTALDNVRKGYD
jgi:hypothetical protein